MTAEDNLLVFMGSTDDDLKIPETFKLISLNLDGSNRRNLHNDGYCLASALWSPQGAGVVIVLTEGTGDFHAGSVIWLESTELPTSSQPGFLLPIMHAYNLHWDLTFRRRGC